MIIPFYILILASEGQNTPVCFDDKALHQTNNMWVKEITDILLWFWSLKVTRKQQWNLNQTDCDERFLHGLDNKETPRDWYEASSFYPENKSLGSPLNLDLEKKKYLYIKKSLDVI